jgi:hypothetical protein
MPKSDDEKRAEIAAEREADVLRVAHKQFTAAQHRRLQGLPADLYPELTAKDQNGHGRSDQHAD